MKDPFFFMMVVVTSGVWKTVGWGSIIYLAAIAGIDPELYDAAEIDGAGRLQILDEMYNNPEVFATAFYGIKGTHWDYNEAGDPIRAEGWTAPASFMQSGATYFRLTAVPTPVEFLYMRGNTWRYPVNSYIIDNQVSLDFGFLPALDEEFLVLQAEVKTVEDEFFFKAIAGELDIAAAWDDYVAAWHKSGGDRLLEEITRQYRAGR